VVPSLSRGSSWTGRPLPRDTRHGFPQAPCSDEHGSWHLENVLLPAALLNDSRVEPQLRAVVLRLLSVRPGQRGTAAELAEELEQATARMHSKPFRPRALLWLSLVAAAASLVLAVWTLMQAPRDWERPQPSPLERMLPLSTLKKRWLRSPFPSRSLGRYDPMRGADALHVRQNPPPTSTPQTGEHVKVERPPQQLCPVHWRRPLLHPLLPGRCLYPRACLLRICLGEPVGRSYPSRVLS